jgi:hypothetical protein
VVWAALIAIVGALAAGGIAYATIPDSNKIIHTCYLKSGGNLRVIDDGVTKCKSTETALPISQTGPPGRDGQNGQDGQDGAPGAGADLTTVYSRDSGNADIPAGQLGTVNAECDNGDVPVGGWFGVNGPPGYSIYFSGTHIVPANIGSSTEVAGFYGFTVRNADAAPSIIRIFATVYCVPIT